MLFNIKLSLDNIPFPTFVKDINLNYIGCNKHFVELSGINSEKDLIGKSDIHFIWGQQNPKSAYKYYSDDIAVINDKIITVRVEPVLFYKKNVVTRTIKLPIFNNKNKVSGVLIIFLDVSEDINGKDLDTVLQFYNTVNDEKSYFNTITKKVVHDIQSNLSTLSILTSSNRLTTDDTTYKLVHNTVNKLRDTLNILLESQKNLRYKIENINAINPQSININTHKSKKTIIILSLFIFTIIQEKIIEYNALDYKIGLKFSINNETYYSSIFADETDLSRTISNLLNNAIRAAKSAADKNIVIGIEKAKHNEVSIVIKNKGNRIPEEILEYVNYDAAIPSVSIINQGLGLKQAKEMVAKNEGSIFAKINEENEGGIIKLNFPSITAPSWIVQSFQISNNSLIILLYHSNDTLEIFKNKFASFIDKNKINTQIAYFNEASRLMYCIANAHSQIKKNIILFIETDSTDKKYHLYSLLKQINIKNINLIVTPYQYKKPDISINKDIKILPKLFIEDVYLYTSSEVLTMNANTTDLVVIDDDENFLYAMANFFFNGKNIDTYEDTIRFINNIDSYTKDTIICIDNDLKTAYGVDFAKSLYEKGFKRLFILTGSNKEDIVAPSYITVLNKLHDIHLLKALIS